MDGIIAEGFDQWMAQLRELAEERELQWLVSEPTIQLREAYDGGASPEDELAALAEMAEWRGCGCGGG